MLYAAQFGLINIVKFIESESPQFNLSYANAFGEGLLHYAAKGNQAKMVSYLLQKGVDPNMQNKFLETPMFIAAEMGSEQVLHILASDKRCRIDHQDKFGDTVLHFACRDGQFEIVAYLVKKSRRLARIKNQEGKTPLSYAIENAQTSCVQLLRENDAEATWEDRTKCVQELARKLMNEPPDYKKSIFKHTASKIEVYGKKLSREQIRAEKAAAEEQAEIRKKKAEVERQRQLKRAKEQEEREKKQEAMQKAKELLAAQREKENQAELKQLQEEVESSGEETKQEQD